MSLPPDLVEMLSVFANTGVRYLVIGGHAVSLHSRPRTTKDLDLWLDPAPDSAAHLGGSRARSRHRPLRCVLSYDKVRSARSSRAAATSHHDLNRSDRRCDNIARAREALERFGVPSGIVNQLRASRPDEIVWMGRIPARVDFLQTVPGLEFETSWSRRVTATIADVEVQFIGRADLVLNKRLVGRPQDRRDVRALEFAAGAPPRKRSGAKLATSKTRPRRKP